MADGVLVLFAAHVLELDRIQAISGGGNTLEIPEPIQRIIGHRPYSVDTVGKSNSQVICFADMVLKIEQKSQESGQEHRMLAWLADKLPVPNILCSECTQEVNYLLMSRLDGTMSCSETMLEQPGELVRLLAEGLCMLWDVDTTACPYQNGLDQKLTLAEWRIGQNLCNMEDAEPETYGKNGFQSPRELLQWLKEHRPAEELVFSHGDYCLPNIFVHRNRIAGFIDVGRSGIADRYQDIALCYRSLQHNFDGAYGGKVYPGFDAALLFDALGMIPDWEKVRYYILLDELF